MGIFQGYLWIVTRPGADVCFHWRASRRHAEATSLLKGFSGLLQADGYAAYDARSPPNAPQARSRGGLLGARPAQDLRGARRGP